MLECTTPPCALLAAQLVGWTARLFLTSRRGSFVEENALLANSQARFLLSPNGARSIFVPSLAGSVWDKSWWRRENR